MWYWRDQQFKDLTEIAGAARAAGWSLYADYCTQRERGLRHEALALLQTMISSLNSAPLPERIRFASWVMNAVDEAENLTLALPEFLWRDLVKPTLLLWIEAEPTNSEPHRWLGELDHLRRAIELDPKDEIARYKLVKRMLARVAMNTHELPIGYLDSPEDDSKSLVEAEHLLSALPAPAQQHFSEQIKEQRTLIQTYLDQQNARSPRF